VKHSGQYSGHPGPPYCITSHRHQPHYPTHYPTGLVAGLADNLLIRPLLTMLSNHELLLLLKELHYSIGPETALTSMSSRVFGAYLSCESINCAPDNNIYIYIYRCFDYLFVNLIIISSISSYLHFYYLWGRIYVY